jgi:hypothetical protein
MVVVLVYLVEDRCFARSVSYENFPGKSELKNSSFVFGALVFKHTAQMLVEGYPKDCAFISLQMCFVKLEHLKRKSMLVF